MGVSSAILSFNEGNAGLLRVYDKAGIIPGNFTKVGFMLTGVKRVTSMNRKSSEGEQQIRRRIRASRKGHGDTCKENKGEVYSAGVF